MADVKLKADTAVTNVIDTGATLADTVLVSGDYDNGTALDLWCNVYLTVQYDGGPPTAGDIVATLWNLPGDGAGTEVFPEGGAGMTPQGILFVGSFESRDPSTSVDEVLCIPNVQLHPDTNRFVLRNDSGQTFDLTWQLDIKPVKTQVV